MTQDMQACGAICREWLAAKNPACFELSLCVADSNHGFATQGGALHVCHLPLGMFQTACV